MFPHFFQMAITPWKKESGGPKFLDFSWFILNFQKIKKNWFFTEFLGDPEGARCGHIVPPRSQATLKGLILSSSFLRKWIKTDTIITFQTENFSVPELTYTQVQCIIGIISSIPTDFKSGELWHSVRLCQT